jgi:zinc D-Ala-D-Ala carboxypeptidase
MAPRSGPARAATLAALLALAVSLFVQPAVSPGAQAMGPLPACRYLDILTTPRQYSDWPVTLVDTILRVPSSYVPPDLVSVSQAGIAGGGKVRAVVIEDLRAMTEAAAAAGAAIGVQSAYRSYERQQAVFKGWVAELGYDRALQVSARPGHSEHQLGLGIDFRSEPGGDPFDGDWATTKAGKWMKANAWEYGFVMSYPEGKIGVTCYDYEPWHYHYVGRDNAAAIRSSGVTPREWLWANFTTTVVPGKTAKPGHSAGPIETPLATPPASLEPSASPPVATEAPAAPSSSPAPGISSPSAPQVTPLPATMPPEGTPVGQVDGAAITSVALVLGAALVVLVTLWAKVLRRRRPGLGL